MNDITALSVKELQALLQNKQLSSVEATEAYLSNIETKEPSIGAYITVCRENALKQAAEVDHARSAGEALPPLAGVPMAIKDNICTEGLKTTCASRMLENFIPPYTATAAEKLKAQKTVLLGKLNMDEFAMGSSTENSYFHPTHNPADPQRVPGGSSGGSAAAVGAREAAFTLGSDTGGSIRQPAAFCGVVGMKPTYGTVSRYGLIAFASSLDQIGPLTKSVEDSATVMNAIAGHDAKDSTSINRETLNYHALIDEGVKGMKLALPKEFFGEGLHPEIRQAILHSAELLEKQGAQITEVSMPSLKYALPAYYVISSAEASSNLARFDGVKYGYRSTNGASVDEIYKNSRSEGFGAEVKRRIMLGSFALSAGYYDAYYKKAFQARTVIVKEYNAVFDRCDAILSPVAPTTAYKLGEKTANPLEMYMGDIYTVPVNIAGIPALSMPCGTDSQGLPIGLQLIGPAFSEPTLYRIGNCLERITAKKGGTLS